MTATMESVQILRTSERGDFKRCEWQWWMRWREGWTPRRTSTALWFGTGWHRVMDARFPLGRKRGSVKAMHAAWNDYCGDTYKRIIIEGREIDEIEYTDALELGHLLIDAYVEEHGEDEEWEVVAVERPFQIDVPSPTDPSVIIAVYAGTMDKVMRNLLTKEMWIWDHKTARAFPDFRFLTIDDQAGSYMWVGPEVMRFLKLLKKQEGIEGIRFDYVRKGKPDVRPMDENGMRCNKPKKEDYANAFSGRVPFNPKLKLDELEVAAERAGIVVLGEVSKSQPTPLFHREDIVKSDYERVEMSKRVRKEAGRMKALITSGEGIDGLLKTPTKDCPKQCPVFDLCEMHEQGLDWEELADIAYVRLDPYRDHREAMAEQDGVVL